MWRHPAEILSRAGILGHRVHQNGGFLKPSGNVVVFIPSRRQFAFKAMVVIAVVRITVAIAILHASGSVAVPVAGSHRIVAMSFLRLLLVVVVVVVIVLLLMVRRGFELPPGRMLKFVRRLPVAWDLMV
jgi:hypothetical protein